MKAAVYDHAGGPKVLHYADVPDPDFPEDHILIRVEAVSIEGATSSTVPAASLRIVLTSDLPPAA